MKKYLFITFVAFSITGCSNNKKADEKKIEDSALNAILKVHDKVMAHDEQAVHNRMLLDTLYKTNKAKAAADLITNLNMADSSMEKWMQGFDPDKKGKSHNAILDYLKGQKRQIAKVDSQLSVAISQSAIYLKATKK